MAFGTGDEKYNVEYAPNESNEWDEKKTKSDFPVAETQWLQQMPASKQAQ